MTAIARIRGLNLGHRLTVNEALGHSNDLGMAMARMGVPSGLQAAQIFGWVCGKPLSAAGF